MMEQDIKYNDIQERQGYASPDVKVVEIKAQGVLCGSNPNSTEQYEREDW